jgi:hypothetical protein
MTPESKWKSKNSILNVNRVGKFPKILMTSYKNIDSRELGTKTNIPH